MARGEQLKRSDRASGKPLAQMTEGEVMAAYEDYVGGVASKLMRGLKIKVDREDVLAYGMEGLLSAWRRYDPNSKAAFSSYAYYRIRGAILDGCRKEGWASRERRTNVSDYARVNDHLESNHEANVETPPAATLSDSIDRVSNAIGDVLTIMMVSNADLEEILTPHEPPQDKVFERKAKNARLDEAIRQLDENEQILVKRHHYYDEPLTTIAEDLNLSLSWCSRIHARALEKLRAILTAESGDSP